MIFRNLNIASLPSEISSHHHRWSVLLRIWTSINHVYVSILLLKNLIISSCVNWQASSAPGLLKPPTLSPPPLTFRQFERPPPEEPKSPILTAKIITHNERIGSKTMTYSEKISVPIPTSTKATEKGKPQEPQQTNGKMQRKSSWKLSSRPSLRRKKKRSGSDSDAIPLNNGRDHSQCNGGGVTRHVSI